MTVSSTCNVSVICRVCRICADMMRMTRTKFGHICSLGRREMSTIYFENKNLNLKYKRLLNDNELKVKRADARQ